jgi:hypothetical protein
MRLTPGLRAVAFAGLLGFSLARPVVGQSPLSATEPAVPEKAGKILRAYRVTGSAPTIDGNLDDEVWTFAASIDDFVQNEPNNMAAPRDRTVMQIAYDDRRLYVAIRCFTTDVTAVTTGIGRRDNLPPSDLLRLSFDPRHDHLNAYVFETNPSGMQSDYLFYDDTRQSSDYDAVWDVRTHIGADSWTAEYSIPFSQMRFTAPPGERVVWGLNLRRDVYSTGEFDRWVGTPRGAAGFVSRFGHLVFEEGMAPPRRLELLPVTLSRFEQSTDTASDVSAAAGLDARIGLGSAATLLATVNPDFGQVEQDPSVLNLSVFETFYPEKRPFFLEDSRTFVPPYNQMLLFHSRRIGKKPGRIALPSGDTEISRPDTTTILGASKVTGKVGRWTYGGLTALTAEEFAKVEHDTTDASGQTVRVREDRLIEPRTMFSVGRIIRDVGKSSTLGGLATAVVRDGNANAFSAGSDYNLRWDRNRANWNGMVAGTHAPFTTDDVTDMRDGLGWVTNGTVQRKYWNTQGHFDYFSRDFKNTDLGYLGTRPNKYAYNGNINVQQPDPHGIFRNYGAYANGGEVYNGDRVLLERRLFIGNSANFKDYSFAYLEGERYAGAYDDLDTRGGPVIAVPGRWNIFAGYGSDSRKSWRIFTRNWYGRTAAGGRHSQFYQSIELKPAPQVQTSISSEYEDSIETAQWISNTDVTGDGVTEPIYGRLGRNVWSLTGRVTYAFSRDMTLEGYLQPFVAVGHYTDIRRFSKPFSYDFDPATLTTNPDFNTKSVNTNVVFRWEYVKGSSLFLVWNTSRSDASRPGTFTAWRDLGSAFGGDGTNVFIVKMNYWLGL